MRAFQINTGLVSTIIVVVGTLAMLALAVTQEVQAEKRFKAANATVKG